MRQQPKCGHTIFDRHYGGCKKLQTDYYNKLKENDFDDIEDTSHPDRLLKAWHSFKFPLTDVLKRKQIEDYYNSASSLLHSYLFEKPIHRFIWELHCEGKSKRDIELAVAESNFDNKCKRETILRVITKIAKEVSGVRVRSFKEEDAPFISSTWRNGFYYGSLKPIEIDKDIWFEASRDYVSDSLKKSKIVVAFIEEDPDFILGYCISKGNELQWVYVRDNYRKSGIGKLLVSKQLINKVNMDNLTKIGSTLLSKLKLEK